MKIVNDWKEKKRNFYFSTKNLQEFSCIIIESYNWIIELKTDHMETNQLSCSLAVDCFLWHRDIGLSWVMSRVSQSLQDNYYPEQIVMSTLEFHKSMPVLLLRMMVLNICHIKTIYPLLKKGTLVSVFPVVYFINVVFVRSI